MKGIIFKLGVLFLILGLTNMAAAMQIFVKDLTGSTFPLEVESSDTILEIKKKIQAQRGIPVDRQLLYLDGERLKNDHTVADYKIKSGSILVLP